MKQKWALITGASAGLGVCFAEYLAKDGYSLVLVARRRERMEELKKRLSCECKIISADLSDMTEVERVFEEISSLNLQMVVNNAGFGHCGPFLESDVQKELNMIDVNVKAMHLVTKLALLHMCPQNSGYILNVCSSAGLIPAGPYMATYYATKAYATSLTRAVERELKEAKINIKISALCPGPVDTEFNSIANCEFKLKGIKAEYCVKVAMKGLKKEKTTIVPTFTLRVGMVLGRLLPTKLYLNMVSHQQRKKIYG